MTREPCLKKKKIRTFPPVWLYLRQRIWAPSYLSAGIPTPPPPGLTLTFSAGLSGRQPQLTPHGLGSGLPRRRRSFSHTCVPGPAVELRSPPRVCDVSSPVAASANGSGGVWQRSEPRPLVGWLEAQSPPIDSRRGSSGVLRVSGVDQGFCG